MASPPYRWLRIYSKIVVEGRTGSSGALGLFKALSFLQDLLVPEELEYERGLVTLSGFVMPTQQQSWKIEVLGYDERVITSSVRRQADH